MTFTRAAAVVTGGALLVAWFAAAGGAPEQPDAPPRAPAGAAATSGPGSLAAQVEQQAAQLRERLARAPAPAVQPRNPFSFGSARTTRRSAAAPPEALPAEAAVAEMPEPPLAPLLVLMGIAEEPSIEGLHRTAILGGEGDAIYIVMEGQAFAGRYKVRAIGVDSIELEDLTTGGFRRLALR